MPGAGSILHNTICATDKFCSTDLEDLGFTISQLKIGPAIGVSQKGVMRWTNS